MGSATDPTRSPHGWSAGSATTFAPAARISADGVDVVVGIEPKEVDPLSTDRSVAPDRRAEVGAVRSLIRQAAPEAEEAVQWGMLTYRVGGSALVALASQKRHLSLYLLETCSDPEVLEPSRGQLAALDMGKGRRSCATKSPR